MAVRSELGDYDRGRLASRAIKKNFVKLSKALSAGDILPIIFEKDLVSEELFDLALSAPKRSGVEARLVRAIQERVQADPVSFDHFCEILQKNELGDLSSLLKETYDTLKAEPVKGSMTLPEFSQEFQQMKEDLDLYTRQLSKGIGNPDDIDKLIKSLITLTIENAFKSGETLDSVRSQVHALSYTTFSIPPRLGAWAIQEVEDIYEKLTTTTNSSVKEETPEEPESAVPVNPMLRSPEKLLYHSSLCCVAVNCCTTATFDDFLSTHGHKLTEAKLSISQDKVNVDRYMIAEQESTLYVAFQSEPDLSHWLESAYSSFDEGFRKQTSRIPLRFFEEQLADNKEIVFTGFGFGGMLACYVAASLWKESFITMDILERNVMCITFGQPLIGIPFSFLFEATPLYEKFKSSMHIILDREDIYPALLCHLIGCIDDTEGNQRIKWNSPMSTKKLRGTFSLQLFQNLATFTEKKSYSAVMSSSHVSQALQEIKDILKETCAVKDIEPDVPFGEATILSSFPLKEQFVAHQEPSKNLLITARQGLLNLEVSSFEKFNMDKYHARIVKYIGKEAIPRQSEIILYNGYLKPDVRAIEFHKYPNEHAVILEGENLWFCHEIRLGEEENIINIEDRADDVSRRFIQFNYSPTRKTDRIVSDNGIVKVTLKSHFSNPVRRRIKVKQEPHVFSVRQIQLAKYTPTELIRLAYWSALLEQLPEISEGHSPSCRLKKVAEFLQEAVRIVPLESILSAIAFAEDKTAFKCAKALVQSHPVIPPSAEAVLSAQIGAVRLHTGLNGSIVNRLINRKMNQIHAQFSFTRHVRSLTVVAPTSTSVEVSVNILLPVIYPTSLNRKFSDVLNKAVSKHSTPIGGLLYQDVHVPTTFDVTPLIPKGAEKDADLAKQLTLYSKKLFDQKKIVGTLSNLSIEHIYPVVTSRRHSLYLSTLQSPLDILNNARASLASFSEESVDDEAGSMDDVIPSNEKMLNLLREIDENNLKVCAALLGSFMEQQISIPLIKSELDTANILSEKSSPVAIGAWVLFSSGYAGVLSKLSSRQGSPLLVQIADYISGILSDGLEKPSKITSKYDAKLQFLLHGIKKTVSCSSQYISYSLERQLCKNLKFPESISVQELLDNWDTIFEGDALSLVARSHRPLTARWLKWALLIHKLREALAEYSCVGVTGLVNSGKSQLVSKLFGVKTLVGTTGHKRTTIPMLYNLDGKVDGLDVIDFPGVDDSEHSIPELASLLLGLLQVVIFVVDYKRVFSDASMSWLKYLGEKKIPVVVCLTFGDHLYFEVEEQQKRKSKELTSSELAEEIRRIIGNELLNTRRKLKQKVLSSLDFLSYCCFHIQEMQRSREGDLRAAGVLGVKEVGEQVVKVFKLKKMTDLATRLLGYQHNQDQMAFLPTTSDGLLQKQTSLLVRARNISNVPFLGEPVIFNCDSSGGVFNISSHGISLQVPQGAIPAGKHVQFELAVTLIGPFQFSDQKNPISPILWLCTHEDVTFQKPIQVKLPHYLSGLKDEERLKFQVNFAKADHPAIGLVEAPLPQVEFKPCLAKAQFVVNENGSYGLLQTTHCCFLCIEAQKSLDLALRAGYCLTRVEYQPSPTRHIVHFCATFQLDTCLDALQKQYPEDYNFVSTNFMFKDTEDQAVNAELQIHPIVDKSTCTVALEPKKGRIRITDIDFWTANVDIEGMKLRQKNLTYPPRIRMTLGLKSKEEVVIPIEFKGCTDDSDLDIELMVKAQVWCQSESVLSSHDQSVAVQGSRENDGNLGMEDHFDVVQYLGEMNVPQIRKLGGALGLHYPNLKKMDSPLEDMIEAWLRKDDNVLVRSGPPCWKSLVKALEEINCTGLADKIRKSKL